MSEPFCGLEPFEGRDERYVAFTERGAKQRFGLSLDTGAPKSAAGIDWINAYINAYELQSSVEWVPHHAELFGIGSGSASCNWKPQLPISLDVKDAGPQHART